MKIDRVKVSRKYQIAEYEPLEVGYEASLDEDDNPLDATKHLEDLCELYLTVRTMKDAEDVRVEQNPMQAAIEQELLQHEGWKGKKKPEGGYEQGDINRYAWDFIYEADRKTLRFTQATVDAIAGAGVLTVGNYVFQLGLGGSVIQVKREKSK